MPSSPGAAISPGAALAPWLSRPYPRQCRIHLNGTWSMLGVGNTCPRHLSTTLVEVRARLCKLKPLREHQ